MADNSEVIRSLRTAMSFAHQRRLVLGGLLTLPLTSLRAQRAAPRVLHVMSYREDWQWNKDQLRGFMEELGIPDAQLKVVALDAKHADPSVMKRAAQEALGLMAQWKPDLVYTNDDAAQSGFAVQAATQYSRTPFVYSGVNKEHADYAFDKMPNVTGVLEREHFVGTLALLRELKPGLAKLRLAIVLDDDPTWAGVSARIRQDLQRHPDVEVVQWLQPRTLEEYQGAMLALPGKVDAVGLLGIFRFAKPDGKLADYEDVLRWTAQHSRLPDFSFWDTRVERGTLCAMTVDGVEQGRMAGRMARRILVQGVAPATIAPEPTTKGRPMLSLARARALGLAVQSRLLLGSTVLTRYAWDA